MLPQSGGYIPAAATGDLAFYVVGAQSVDIYNVATALWSQASLSAPREGVSAAATDGVALFAGGFTKKGASDVVDLYNTRTGRWSASKLSQARSGMTVATIGDEIVLAGGDLSSGGASSAVDIYNTRTGHWHAASLSVPMSQATATVVRDMALFAGGGTVVESNGELIESNVVDSYDTATGEISAGVLSQARGGIAATSVENFALLGGGVQSATNPPQEGAPSDVVDVYDDSTETWSASVLSSARTGIAAAAVNNLALFAGGESGSGGDVSTVDIFDSGTETWSTASLLHPESGLLPQTLGNDVIFATDGATFPVVYIYEAGSGNFATLPLSAPRTGMASVGTDGTALFAGGFLSRTQSATALVDLFTIPNLAGSVSAAHKGAVSVTLNNQGGSALPGPGSVAVYASASGALDGNALLIGSVKERRSLVAGATEQASVPISIPPTLPAGSYHLIAAAGPAGQLVEFAAQRRLLVVTQPAVAVQRAELVLPPTSVFNTAPAIGGSVLKEAEDVLS